MHVAAVMVFDGGGFVGPDGALNARELTARLAAGIERIPRSRQRVRGPAVAVWEDDPGFGLIDTSFTRRCRGRATTTR